MANASALNETCLQGDAGEEDLGGPSCPRVWDTLMCWPRTAGASWASMPCFAEISGARYDTSQNATKWCWPNGTWERYSNYTQCTPLFPTAPEMENSVEIMTQLYFIGYGLSLSTLIIAAVIYLHFRELRCLRNIIHTNLMFTYILADALWIITVMSQVSLPSTVPICIIFFSLYHYFQLTNFFWMFVEGLYLYLLVVKTFSGDNIKLKMCLFIGWGMPLIVVAVWGTAKSLGQNLATVSPEEQALAEHCPWMIKHPFDWFYQIPAIFVLCLNVLFLFMIMWVLITKLRSATNSETQQYRKAAKALLVLIPLLGITYILALAGPSDGPLAQIFQYIRALLLSTQGFSVAVFYCFLNSEVRNALRHRYQRWAAERSLGAGQRYYAHWAPRSHTESVRLYCRPANGPATPPPEPEPCHVPLGHGRQTALSGDITICSTLRGSLHSESGETLHDRNHAC